MSEVDQISRRNFFKLAAAAVGGAWAGTEIRKIIDPEISLDHANYFFIPENHKRRTKREAIPAQVNVIYQEQAGPIDVVNNSLFEGELTKEEIEEEIKKLRNALYGDSSNLSVSEDAVNNINIALKRDREFLLEGKTLAWSDVAVYLPTLEGYFSSEDRNDRLIRIGIFSGLNFLGTALRLAASNIESVKRSPRRGLVIKLGILATFSGMMNALPQLTDAAFTLPILGGNSVSVTDRVAVRIKALSENLAPYDLTIFFRNVFVASQLLSLGEALHHTNQLKPYIAFNYGAAHGGIEDFLRMGQKTCLALLSTYPKDLWQKLVDTHGGVEKLSSVVSIKLVEGELIREYTVNEEMKTMIETKLL